MDSTKERYLPTPDEIKKLKRVIREEKGEIEMIAPPPSPDKPSKTIYKRDSMTGVDLPSETRNKLENQ